jgi:hypothetical protein
MLWDEETLNESFILQFNDPFEDNKDLIAMELIEKCYTLLEEKNPAYTKIFDERLKGNPNRVIAQVLNLDISIVEGIWKKIMRLLRKKIPRRPLEQLFTNNIGN